jgi:hypothetical protein
MGKAKWVGPDLWNLLNLSLAELQVLYPAEQRNTLKGKRAYWKTKLLEGKIEMPEKPISQPNPERETITQEEVDGSLVSEISGWYEMVTKNADGEAEVHRLYKHSTKKRPLPEDSFEAYAQAAPARINPSRRKVPLRDHKRLFVFSDAQIDYRRLPSGELEPIHDERALKVARLICCDVQPDEIINLGDTVDLAALSRFDPDSDHFQRTLGPAFQRVHDMYAEYRADNPHAKITEVDSNHNTRLKKFFLKNTGPLYGFNRPGAQEGEYPMFTYPYMTNLLHVNVEWVSGYGAAEYVYGDDYGKPPIIFKHGNSVASNSSTAAKESRENPETHVVRGHSHRTETAHRTTRSGNYLASIVVGALCRIDGAVPGYGTAVDDRGEVVKKQQNWQNSIMVIRDYDGDYEFQHVLIRDGVAHYNGRKYDGTS